MSKINYNRPVFKIIDSIRREKVGSNFTNCQSLRQEKTGRSMPRRLMQEKNERAYNQHFDVLCHLPDKSQAVIDHITQAACDLVDARILYIQSMGKSLGGARSEKKMLKKRKAEFNEAIASLKDACIKFNAQCQDELRDGKSITRNWWLGLRVIMGKEWEGFDEVDQFLDETRRL